MDAVFLSRVQFALTIGFHYIYPPLSIGLGLIIVFIEALYLKTKDEFYKRMAKFWVKIFALTFTLGVATGIVMEFEFGTNWATYSRFVGDVFGSPLAAEGVFAFFLESGFLAILVFGWNRVGRGMHFFSSLMVMIGAHLSALWIIVANSWQQTPKGFHVVGEGLKARAEIVDFWAMVFNPSTIDRFTHTVIGAWQAGAFFVLSIAAYYLLKKRHEDFARICFKITLPIALIASILQLTTGHSSAVGVSENQPAKLAAFEGHYEENAPAAFYLFGWVDEKGEKVRFGIGLPKMLSFLVHFDPNRPVKGLRAFKPDERPPVNIVFQSYHLMIAIGIALIGLSVLGYGLMFLGKLFSSKWLLWMFVFSFLGPQIANQAGWFSAEVGRQPWIVYGLLKTKDAVSKTVTTNEVLFSLILFGLIYILLFALFVFLLLKKIQKGPDLESQGGAA